MFTGCVVLLNIHLCLQITKNDMKILISMSLKDTKPRRKMADKKYDEIKKVFSQNNFIKKIKEI